MARIITLITLVLYVALFPGLYFHLQFLIANSWQNCKWSKTGRLALHCRLKQLLMKNTCWASMQTFACANRDYCYTYLMNCSTGSSRLKYMWLEANVVLQWEWRAMGDARPQSFRHKSLIHPILYASYIFTYLDHISLLHTQMYYSRSYMSTLPVCKTLDQ